MANVINIKVQQEKNPKEEISWKFNQLIIQQKKEFKFFQQSKPFRTISVCGFETSYVRTSMVSPG